jgi:CRP/FNR family transcriptional regulator
MLIMNKNVGKPGLAPKGPLAGMEVFLGLTPQDLREIEGRVIEKRYAKGDPIFLEGDPAKTVWFVREGHVKAVSNASSGRCQTLCMVGKGRMFGSCCCFGGGEYPCQAVAETDVNVLALPMDDFLAFLDRHPRAGKNLVALVSRQLRHTKDSQVFEQESVERRILHALVDLVGEFGPTIPLTKREVAEMVGTTVESSIRTFSRLEDDGLVATARGRITVRSLQDLKGRLQAE